MLSEIRGVTMQGFLFGPNFLEQYAGARILSDSRVAMNELVANAWDAGATKVAISIPAVPGGEFSIRDNGSGMTRFEFETRWRTLSYDRLASQGASAEFPPGVTLLPRRVFGRNGIGRFAAFCFGDSYEISTTKSGHAHRYSVFRGTTIPLEFKLLSEEPAAGSGTCFRVVESKRVIEPEVAAAELALRFLVDPNFEVLINNKPVVFHDLPTGNVKRISVGIGGRSVEILVIDLGQADKTTQQHGIAFHVSKRLVGDCSWAWLSDKTWIDGRTTEAKRFTFIVLADEFDDAVLPDWTGFRTNESATALLNGVRAVVRQKILEATAEKTEETTKTVKEENASIVAQLLPKAKERWAKFVEEAPRACPTITTSQLSALAEVLGKLELASSKFSLIDQLNRLSPDDLDGLNQVLEDWSLEAAKAVLDELQRRFLLVDDLKSRIDNIETDELHDLQPLFHRGLWIFGPEFETIEYTSNEGMTKVIQKLFKLPDEKGTKIRPDFAIVPDGTAGFYDYPSFDQDGGESGIDRLVIVELKKPGIAIGDDQKNQAWKYVKELNEKGFLGPSTRVTCFVLGSKVLNGDHLPRTELGGRCEIFPMRFETVIRRANSRLLKLQDRVAHAPFLNQKKIEEFVGHPSLLSQPAML